MFITYFEYCWQEVAIYKGHVVSPTGWYGVALACFGITGELHDKYRRRRTYRQN